MKILLWILRIVPAFILLQTVIIYKFPGHPESIALFTELSNYLGGAISESMFRYGTGISEVIASILILIPKTAKCGALLIVGIMLGAILSHVLVLGYDKVFVMALITLTSCITYLVITNKKINL